MITASPLPWSIKVEHGFNVIVDSIGNSVATFGCYKDAEFVLALIEGTEPWHSNVNHVETLVDDLHNDSEMVK